MSVQGGNSPDKEATMRNFVILAVLATGVVSAACGPQPVRQYCSTEMSYIIRAREHGYRLELHLGKMPSSVCNSMPDRQRSANLDADVPNVDEALRLVEQHRQRYPEALTRPSLSQKARRTGLLIPAP